ncbi:MAG: alpha/beta hydrolase [Dehalococcoidia bacterium]
MTSQGPRDGTVQANGLTLHYLDWGSPAAPPLVLVHHVSSHAHTWDAFAARMARDYRVVAIDLRGHGDSGWAGLGNYTTEQYASDIAAVVDQLGLSRVVVLGGSLGGRAALVYAAEHPDKAAALIMEDVGAVRPPSIAAGFAARIEAGEPELDTAEEWAAQLRGTNERTPPEYFLHLAQHGTKRLPNGKLGLKRDPAIQKDFVPMELWRYVDQVKAPFLLLIGAESAIVGPDQQEEFPRRAPHIEIETIAGAGHIIVHDRLDAFEASVRGFLKRHGL